MWSSSIIEIHPTRCDSQEDTMHTFQKLFRLDLSECLRAAFVEFVPAICLPLSLLAIALVDLDHFFEHGINQDHLDNQAMRSDERRMHRAAFLRAQKSAKEVVQDQYEEIAEDRAQSFVDKARDGDLTFGASDHDTEKLSHPKIRQLEPPVEQVEGTVWPVDTKQQPGQQDWANWQ